MDGTQLLSYAPIETAAQLVVSDPYVEEITEHVHGRGVARGSAGERFECGDRSRAGR
jgi:hypothetical protein